MLSGYVKIFQKLMLNLNVPDLPLKSLKGIRVVKQGFRIYGDHIVKRQDHRGKIYYWLGGQYQGYKLIEKSLGCVKMLRTTKGQFI